jgi:hypothetical protein
LVHYGIIHEMVSSFKLFEFHLGSIPQGDEVVLCEQGEGMPQASVTERLRLKPPASLRFPYYYLLLMVLPVWVERVRLWLNTGGSRPTSKEKVDDMKYAVRNFQGE